MPNLIITQAPVATIDAFKTAVTAQITALGPYKVGLNDTEKIGARSMSSGREGYARLVSQIATANINSLARELNPVDLANKLAYDSKLEEARQLAMTLLEIVTETQMANSVDVMKLVDAYATNLQASRKNNSALDTAMKEVDDFNKRFVKTQKKEEPIPVNPA